MNLAQLTRLHEVCVRAINRSSGMMGGVQPDFVKKIYVDHKEQATAALADIDAEIKLLKGTS